MKESRNVGKQKYKKKYKTRKVEEQDNTKKEK